MTLEQVHAILHAICCRCRVETILLRAWQDRDGVTFHAAIYTRKENPNDLAPRLAKEGLQLEMVSVVEADTFRYDMKAVG